MRKLIYLFIIGLVSSCTADSNQMIQEPSIDVTTAGQNLNISIFLDLSDRISPSEHPNETMEYFERDLGYINSIAQFFKAHVLSKKSILLNDRMQLFLDPPPANPSINEIKKNLRIAIDKDNAEIEEISKIDELYDSLSRSLYELTIEDDYYPGSDIWGFFKNNVKDYCISSDHRNILIVITDGYVFHEKNKIKDGNRTSYLLHQQIEVLKPHKGEWENRYEEEDYGFIVANQHLVDLEVMVLGLNTYGRTSREGDVMQRYWTDWLSGMGVKKMELKEADLPSNLNEVIHNFIGSE